MKKKLVLALSFAIMLVCVFALSVCAAEISVNKIESETYGTVYQLSADPGLDEAHKYVSTLNNVTDSGKDTEALCILTDKTYFYVFPARYVVYEISNGKFEVYAGTDAKPGVNQAFAEWNAAEGTALPTFELTGSYGSTNFIDLIRIEITSDVTYFDTNHCRLTFTNLKEVRFRAGQKIVGGLFNSAPALETVIGMENCTGFNGSTHMFRNCTNLKTVTLPSGLTSIGKETFYNCQSLETIGNWDNAVANITSIGDEAFYNCKALRSAKLPNTVTSIGKNGFRNCSTLTEFDVPDSLETLGGAVFAGCTGITRFEFPPTTTGFGQDCFNGCSSLVYINVPRDCTYIGNYTFSGCSNLETLDMSAATSLKSTGSNNDFGKITELVFPEGFETFGGITSGNITKLVFPNSTTSLGIIKCTSLEEFVVPAGVTSLRDKQFDYCNSLKKVTIPMGVTSISSTGNTSFFGTSKSNLKTIVFTGKADAEILATIQAVVPNATIEFANHCEVYYASNHVVSDEQIKFVGDAFVSVAQVCTECTRCLERAVLEEHEPLVEWKGWTYAEYEDGGAFGQSFLINTSVLDFYETNFGVTNYGIVAAINTYYVDDVETVYSDGNIISVTDGEVKTSNKAVSADFTNSEFSLFKMKVVGLTGNNEKAKLFINAFIVAGNDVYYINEQASSKNEAKYSVSLQDIKNK